MLVARNATKAEIDDQSAIGKKSFSIKKDTKETLRYRIHYLTYEADVDLLEIGTFASTVNLAVLSLEATTSGLPTHTFDFMFHFVPTYVWFALLLTLAFVELGASLLDKVFIRCWTQFTACLIFLAYAAFVMLKSPWIPSPRDYIIFAALAGIAHLRLRKQAREDGKTSLAALARRLKKSSKHTKVS